MTLRTLLKASATALLGLSLAGCVDVAVDVALTSSTTAEATLTQTMVADFYAMKGAGENPDEPNAADLFCPEGELTENADGSATCTLVETGAFGDLDLGQEEGGISFAPAGEGLVRVSMSTAELQQEISGNEPLDAETAAMADAFFAGRTFTVTFRGSEIIDTNMTVAADKTSATQSIPIVGMIKGDIELPDEYFAVVRAP